MLFGLINLLEFWFLVVLHCLWESQCGTFLWLFDVLWSIVVEGYMFFEFGVRPCDFANLVLACWDLLSFVK